MMSPQFMWDYLSDRTVEPPETGPIKYTLTDLGASLWRNYETQRPGLILDSINVCSAKRHPAEIHIVDEQGNLLHITKTKKLYDTSGGA